MISDAQNPGQEMTFTDKGGYLEVELPLKEGKSYFAYIDTDQVSNEGSVLRFANGRVRCLTVLDDVVSPIFGDADMLLCFYDSYPTFAKLIDNTKYHHEDQGYVESIEDPDTGSSRWCVVVRNKVNPGDDKLEKLREVYSKVRDVAFQLRVEMGQKEPDTSRIRMKNALRGAEIGAKIGLAVFGIKI